MSAEVPKWAEPKAMARTYALLYNTLLVCNAPYMMSQMSEDVWRLVYGSASCRPRHMSWAKARDDNRESRAFVYAERRTTAQQLARQRELRVRIATLRDSVDLTGAVQERMVERAREELRRVERPTAERFPRPPRDTHAALANRSFQIQHHDAYLCGMHSLNNVANCVLLSPPDILQTVELMRSLEPRFAAYEELALAALREGIFLMPVKLTDPSDLNPLDYSESAPRSKYFLDLLEEAGGMVVYQPSAPPALGHYVSLVYVPEAEDPDSEWVVYSTDHVVARGATAADALDRYILSVLYGAQFGKDAEYGTGDTRERRRQEAAARCGVRDAQKNFVGLLPIALDALVDDSTQVSLMADLSDKRRERIYVLRTLVRRALSEMRVQGSGDLTLPPPISPGNFDAMAQFFAINRVHSDDELHFDGLDVANVASFVTVRFTADQTINKAMDALARRALLELDSSAPWSALEARDDALATLVELRSYMRSMPVLGLFFAMRDNFGKFSRLMSNRRWFRYFVLQLAITGLIETLRAGRGALVPVRIVVLLCFVGFCNLQAAGVRLAATPAIVRLYARVGELGDERHKLLPLDDAPPNIGELVRRSPATQRGPLFSLLINCSYDASLWLLQAIERARLPQLPCNATLAPLFAIGESDRERVSQQLPSAQRVAERDDSSIAYDQLSSFVTLLRVTLFALPFEHIDNTVVQKVATAVRSGTPTHTQLVSQMHEAASRFVREATTERLMAPERARDLVDALAFDARYTDDERQADAAEWTGDAEARSLDSETKPRYTERLAQFGIDEAYRQTFGAFCLSADRRTPITDNVERLPLPRVPGNWLTARPLVHESVLLACAPLHVLPTLAQVERESSLFALDSSDGSVDNEWHTVGALAKSKRAAAKAAKQKRAGGKRGFVAPPMPNRIDRGFAVARSAPIARPDSSDSDSASGSANKKRVVGGLLVRRSVRSPSPPSSSASVLAFERLAINSPIK